MVGRFLSMFKRAGSALFISVMVFLSGCMTAGSGSRDYFVYFGTFTTDENGGIFRSTFNAETGELSEPVLAAQAFRAGFVAIHPDGRHMYSVGEMSGFKGKSEGSVCAWEIDRKTGDLKPLNSQSSKGANPCHLIVDNEGRNVLVANYTGGSCAVLPIASDGSLEPTSSFHQHQGSSINQRRQEKAHAHSINLDAAGRIAVVADLGMDKVMIYSYDSRAGKLVPGQQPFVTVKAGGGPRHFVFHPSGKFAYVNNELTGSVTAFSYNAAKGVFTEIQMISTLPADFKEKNTTAEVRVTPDGKFFYVSNRGHNTIAMYSINQDTGKLKLIGYEPTRGKTPRNFNLDPTGKYMLVAHQDTDNVTVFKVDQETGRLSFTGREIKMPKPVCVRFMAR